jgi:hypothetical protein
MRGRSIQQSSLIILFLIVALLWAGGAVAKGGLNCPCTNCTYAQGRAQSTYVFQVDFNATAAGRTAYDNAEAAAMKEADGSAVTAMMAAWKNPPSCPQPCIATPFWGFTHGPPFAGGTGGNGIARSLWKISYTCIKIPVLIMAAGATPPQTPSAAAAPPCVGCTVQTQPTPCTSPGGSGCPYSQPQSCTGPNCGSSCAPGTSGCPYAPPQACTGPECSGATSCRGPDGDARIGQLRSDLAAGAPEGQRLLSDYQLEIAGVPVGPGVHLPDLTSFITQVDAASSRLVSLLQTQAQRVDQLNALDAQMPCSASGGPPPQSGPAPFVPGAFGFGFSVGGHGGEDHGGSGEFHGSRGGSDSGQHRP